MDVLSVVTERPTMTTDAQLGTVTIVTMRPWQIILVRAARCYVQTLVGLLTAVGTGLAKDIGVTLSAPDFAQTLLTCAGIALAPAIISLLQNSLELLAKLDATAPAMRA
jgi:hypothetical protein